MPFPCLPGTPGLFLITGRPVGYVLHYWHPLQLLGVRLPRRTLRCSILPISNAQIRRHRSSMAFAIGRIFRITPPQGSETRLFDPDWAFVLFQSFRFRQAGVCEAESTSVVRHNQRCCLHRVGKCPHALTMQLKNIGACQTSFPSLPSTVTTFFFGNAPS